MATNPNDKETFKSTMSLSTLVAGLSKKYENDSDGFYLNICRLVCILESQRNSEMIKYHCERLFAGKCDKESMDLAIENQKNFLDEAAYLDIKAAL